MPETRYKPETILAVLQEYFVGEESPSGEQRMFCPIHEDPQMSKSPSLSLNLEKNTYNCITSRNRASEPHRHPQTPSNLVKEVAKKFNLNIRSIRLQAQMKDPDYKNTQLTKMSKARKEQPLPTEDEIHTWHRALMKDKLRLTAFKDKRGLDNTTIKDNKIGWIAEDGRYSIPVYDVDGKLLNVRKYSINPGSRSKFINVVGHGAYTIYRPDVLQKNTDVVLTEGELDCLLLNQIGIPAVTTTGGATNWNPAWSYQFTDKTVWIAYDNDETGDEGAQKVARALKAFAKAVHIMTIPIDMKGADVTDFIHMHDNTADDFRGLMTAAARAGFVRRDAIPVPTTGEKMSLLESTAEANHKKVIELTVHVTGRQMEPFEVPKHIAGNCDLGASKKQCERCPLFGSGHREVDVSKDDENLFRFLDVPESKAEQLMREALGAKCNDHIEVVAEDKYHVEELTVQPSVDDRKDDESQTPVRRKVFSISTHKTPINQKVRMVGKNVRDPKNGRVKFMSWVNEPVDMDIDKFVLTPEDVEELTIFQPKRGQTPLEKCLEIAEDMSENVTHIYGRDLLHVGYDLVFHSPIAFKIGEQHVDKGWLEMAVIGDTRTGKSEIIHQLIEHYKAGILQSCEGMSFAGLVGGIQKIDDRNTMTWGTIPMNDRRLVALDEMSGMAEAGIIDKMSSIRSSGVAQIVKIESESTSARVRLIWISNPADGGMMANRADKGMDALRGLVRNSEDIARFDFVMATMQDDVPSSRINIGFSQHRSPEYRSSTCEKLVKWVWSLTRDDVIVHESAQRAAVEAAEDLGSRYTSEPPLIQGANVRYKILRLAAAFAARTFSVSPKTNKLYVKEEHVESAVEFLDAIYSQEGMGYARHSRRVHKAHERAMEKRDNARTYFKQQPEVLQTLQAVGTKFKTRDLREFAGLRDDVAGQAVLQLIKWRLVRPTTQAHERGTLEKDPVLVEVLREMEDADEI